jgi:hypothetical protein
MCQVQAWPRRIRWSGTNIGLTSVGLVILHSIHIDFTLAYLTPSVARIYGAFNDAISSSDYRAG